MKRTKSGQWMGRTMGAALALAGAAAPAMANDSFEKALREMPRLDGVPAVGGSFGPGSQATLIPTLHYTPISQGVEYGHRAEGYVFAPGSQNAVLWAALPLQNGVELDSVCFDFLDNNPSAGIVVGLLVAEAGQGITSPPEFASLAAATSPTNGYGHWCLAPTPGQNFPFQIRTFGDATGDGDSSTLQYYLLMAVPPDFSTVGLGAITLRWRRLVAPAPLTAQFADVPTTSPQFRFVEALAAAGITSGCGNGNFCPNAPLTRGQMAVFLSVALGLHWPN